jgi:hypothetical protein
MNAPQSHDADPAHRALTLAVRDSAVPDAPMHVVTMRASLLRRAMPIDVVWCDLRMDPLFTCEDTRAHLHEYVDNELDPHSAEARRIRQALMAHVFRCEHCARLEAQLQSMRQALAAVGARARATAARRAHGTPS